VAKAILSPAPKRKLVLDWLKPAPPPSSLDSLQALSCLPSETSIRLIRGRRRKGIGDTEVNAGKGGCTGKARKQSQVADDRWENRMEWHLCGRHECSCTFLKLLLTSNYSVCGQLYASIQGSGPYSPLPPIPASFSACQLFLPYPIHTFLPLRDLGPGP
jgi:hypothetical protein